MAKRLLLSVWLLVISCAAQAFDLGGLIGAAEHLKDGDAAGIATDAIKGANQVMDSQKPDFDVKGDSMHDEALTAYVRKVLDKLLPFAKDKDFELDIINTAKVQGQSYWNWSEIAVTRGMLNSIRCEAELACLLGHEVGHRDLGHQGGPSKHTASEVVEQTSYRISNGLSDVLWQSSLLMRDIEDSKWSQRQEEEADQYGALLAAKAGYDA